MQALRRRKLNTSTAAVASEKSPAAASAVAEPAPKRSRRLAASIENASTQTSEPKAKPARKPAAAKKGTAAQEPSESEPKVAKRPRGQKRKTPVFHEAAANIPAAPPAAVMADAPDGAIPVAHVMPAVVWTREMLTGAADQLKAKDPVLAPLIEEHGAPDSLLFKGSSNMFGSLARSIVYQQLATSAADKIFGRVLQACKSAFVQQGWDTVELEDLTPASVLAVPLTDLREAGLSTRKAEYMHGIAEAFLSGQLSDEALVGMDEATLSAELIKLRGIGQWSIDMFAMFRLGRPNILPVGDLGVRRGMQTLYKLKGLPEAEEMQKVAAAWEPYRSLGTYLMWRVPTPKASSIGKKAKRSAQPSI